MEAARFFDTTLIRTFSFWKQGSLTPAQEEMIVDAYAEPAEMAERAGLTLILENEHACCLATGAQTARVLAEIGSPAVRAVWDPGNAFMAGELPFPTGYEAIKDFMSLMSMSRTPPFPPVPSLRHGLSSAKAR